MGKRVKSSGIPSKIDILSDHIFGISLSKIKKKINLLATMR